MTCLVDQGSWAAPTTASPYPLTLAVLDGSSSKATPTFTGTGDGGTSVSSASDAGQSSSRTRTPGSRRNARSAAVLCSLCHERPKLPGRGKRLCPECTARPQPPRHSLKPCINCGGTAKKARGEKVCPECAPVVHAAAVARKRAREGMRRRPCRRCGKAKPRDGAKSPFCPSCRELKAQRPKCKRCQRRPIRAARKHLCESCVIQARIEMQLKRNASTRAARARRRVAGVAPENPRGPRSAGVRASARMRDRMLREANGSVLRPAPPIMRHSYGGPGNARVDAQSFPDVPAAPLVAAIDRLIVKERTKLYELALVTCAGDDGAIGRVANRLIGGKDPESMLRRWRKTACVSFDNADRVLANSGLCWFEVWDGHEVCSNGRTVQWVFESTELLADAV